MIGVRSLPSIDENLLPRAGSAADRLAAAATPGILLSSGLAGQMDTFAGLSTARRHVVRSRRATPCRVHRMAPRAMRPHLASSWSSWFAGQMGACHALVCWAL